MKLDRVFGGLEAVKTIHLLGGAGGLAALAGDYRYGAERGAYFEAGMWGVLRVLPRGAEAAAVEPLPGADDEGGSVGSVGGRRDRRRRWCIRAGHLATTSAPRGLTHHPLGSFAARF